MKLGKGVNELSFWWPRHASEELEEEGVLRGLRGTALQGDVSSFINSFKTI